MTNKWQQHTVSDQFNVTNGSTNTDDAAVGGQFPLFDRSVTIKLSDKFLFDTEAVIIPGEGKEFIPRYYKGKFDLHQRAYAIFPKSNNKSVDVKFLFYWMDFNKSYLTKMAVGSTVKSLRMYMLEKFPLVIPSKPIQQKVVDLFTSMDETIQKTDKIIQKSEELKNGLMNELLTKGVGHKKFKKTKLGEIPEEWEIKPLDSVAKVFDSLHQTPKYSAEGISMVRVIDIKSGNLDLSDCIRVSDDVYKVFTKNHVPEQGDTVISRVGSFGVFAYVATTSRFCLGQNTAIISPMIDSKYVYYSLQSPIPTEQVAKQVVGSNQKTLSLKHIRNLQLPLPNSVEQQKIAEILSELDKKISQELNEKEKLESLKKGLMQDIFSQKVKIN